jgi:hypothetical protein
LKSCGLNGFSSVTSTIGDFGSMIALSRLIKATVSGRN